jgi:hypothetical protein
MVNVKVEECRHASLYPSFSAHLSDEPVLFYHVSPPDRDHGLCSGARLSARESDPSYHHISAHCLAPGAVELEQEEAKIDVHPPPYPSN